MASQFDIRLGLDPSRLLAGLDQVAAKADQVLARINARAREANAALSQAGSSRPLNVGAAKREVLTQFASARPASGSNDADAKRFEQQRKSLESRYLRALDRVVREAEKAGIAVENLTGREITAARSAIVAELKSQAQVARTGTRKAEQAERQISDQQQARVRLGQEAVRETQAITSATRRLSRATTQGADQAVTAITAASIANRGALVASRQIADSQRRRARAEEAAAQIAERQVRILPVSSSRAVAPTAGIALPPVAAPVQTVALQTAERNAQNRRINAANRAAQLAARELAVGQSLVQATTGHVRSVEQGARYARQYADVMRTAVANAQALVLKTRQRALPAPVAPAPLPVIQPLQAVGLSSSQRAALTRSSNEVTRANTGLARSIDELTAANRRAARKVESFDDIGATWRNNVKTQQAKTRFDALGDDARVVVYHGTTAERARSLATSGRVATPQGYRSDLPTIARNSLYVAPTAADARNYGPVVVKLEVRKGDLKPSPEALRSDPRASTTKALFNSFDGAVLPPGFAARIRTVGAEQEEVGRAYRELSRTVKQQIVAARQPLALSARTTRALEQSRVLAEQEVAVRAGSLAAAKTRLSLDSPPSVGVHKAVRITPIDSGEREARELAALQSKQHRERVQQLNLFSREERKRLIVPQHRWPRGYGPDRQREVVEFFETPGNTVPGGQGPRREIVITGRSPSREHPTHIRHGGKLSQPWTGQYGRAKVIDAIARSNIDLSEFKTGRDAGTDLVITIKDFVPKDSPLGTYQLPESKREILNKRQIAQVFEDIENGFLTSTQAIRAGLLTGSQVLKWASGEDVPVERRAHRINLWGTQDLGGGVKGADLQMLFTLLHELGHLRSHLQKTKSSRYDSDYRRGIEEARADGFARQMLVLPRQSRGISPFNHPLTYTGYDGGVQDEFDWRYNDRFARGYRTKRVEPPTQKALEQARKANQRRWAIEEAIEKEDAFQGQLFSGHEYSIGYRPSRPPNRRLINARSRARIKQSRANARDFEDWIRNGGYSDDIRPWNADVSGSLQAPRRIRALPAARPSLDDELYRVQVRGQEPITGTPAAGGVRGRFFTSDPRLLFNSVDRMISETQEYAKEIGKRIEFLATTLSTRDVGRTRVSAYPADQRAQLNASAPNLEHLVPEKLHTDLRTVSRRRIEAIAREAEVADIAAGFARRHLIEIGGKRREVSVRGAGHEVFGISPIVDITGQRYKPLINQEYERVVKALANIAAAYERLAIQAVQRPALPAGHQPKALPPVRLSLDDSNYWDDHPARLDLDRQTQVRAAIVAYQAQVQGFTDATTLHRQADAYARPDEKLSSIEIHVKRLIDAIRDAARSIEVLYRGVTGEYAQSLISGPPGSVLNLPLSSFTRDRETAKAFTWGEQPKVLMELLPGAKALDFNKEVPLNEYVYEQELLTRGNFAVVQRRYDAEQKLHILRLKQLSAEAAYAALMAGPQPYGVLTAAHQPKALPPGVPFVDYWFGLSPSQPKQVGPQNEWERLNWEGPLPEALPPPPPPPDRSWESFVKWDEAENLRRETQQAIRSFQLHQFGYNEVGTLREQADMYARPEELETRKFEQDLNRHLKRLVAAIREAASSIEVLYRGVEGPYARSLLSQPPGSIINLPLSSFSRNRRIAETFGRGTFEAGTIIELEPGARALDFNAESPNNMYPRENEMLTQGSFQVVQQRYDAEQRLHIIRLRQLSVQAAYAAIQAGRQPVAAIDRRGLQPVAAIERGAIPLPFGPIPLGSGERLSLDSPLLARLKERLKRPEVGNDGTRVGSVIEVVPAYKREIAQLSAAEQLRREMAVEEARKFRAIQEARKLAEQEVARRRRNEAIAAAGPELPPVRRDSLAALPAGSQPLQLPPARQAGRLSLDSAMSPPEEWGRIAASELRELAQGKEVQQAQQAQQERVKQQRLFNDQEMRRMHVKPSDDTVGHRGYSPKRMREVREVFKDKIIFDYGFGEVFNPFLPSQYPTNPILSAGPFAVGPNVPGRPSLDPDTEEWERTFDEFSNLARRRLLEAIARSTIDLNILRGVDFEVDITEAQETYGGRYYPPVGADSTHRINIPGQRRVEDITTRQEMLRIADHAESTLMHELQHLIDALNGLITAQSVRDRRGELEARADNGANLMYRPFRVGEDRPDPRYTRGYDRGLPAAAAFPLLVQGYGPRFAQQYLASRVQFRPPSTPPPALFNRNDYDPAQIAIRSAAERFMAFVQSLSGLDALDSGPGGVLAIGPGSGQGRGLATQYIPPAYIPGREAAAFESIRRAQSSREFSNAYKAAQSDDQRLRDRLELDRVLTKQQKYHTRVRTFEALGMTDDPGYQPAKAQLAEWTRKRELLESPWTISAQAKEIRRELSSPAIEAQVKTQTKAQTVQAEAQTEATRAKKVASVAEAEAALARALQLKTAALDKQRKAVEGATAAEQELQRAARAKAKALGRQTKTLDDALYLDSPRKKKQEQDEKDAQASEQARAAAAAAAGPSREERARRKRFEETDPDFLREQGAERERATLLRQEGKYLEHLTPEDRQYAQQLKERGVHQAAINAVLRERVKDVKAQQQADAEFHELARKRLLRQSDPEGYDRFQDIQRRRRAAIQAEQRQENILQHAAHLDTYEPKELLDDSRQRVREARLGLLRAILDEEAVTDADISNRGQYRALTQRHAAQEEAAFNRALSEDTQYAPSVQEAITNKAKVEGQIAAARTPEQLAQQTASAEQQKLAQLRQQVVTNARILGASDAQLAAISKIVNATNSVAVLKAKIAGQTVQEQIAQANLVTAKEIEARGVLAAINARQAAQEDVSFKQALSKDTAFITATNEEKVAAAAIAGNIAAAQTPEQIADITASEHKAKLANLRQQIVANARVLGLTDLQVRELARNVEAEKDINKLKAQTKVQAAQINVAQARAAREAAAAVPRAELGQEIPRGGGFLRRLNTVIQMRAGRYGPLDGDDDYSGAGRLFGFGGGGGGGFGGGGEGIGGPLGFFGQGALTTLKYAVPGALLYGSLRTIKELITNAQELELIMGQLQDQFEKTGKGDQFDGARKAILDIAAETGQSAIAITKLYQRFQGVFGQGELGISPDITQRRVTEEVRAGSKLALVTGIPEETLKDSIAAIGANFGNLDERFGRTGKAGALAIGQITESIGNLAISVENQFGVAASEVISFLGDLAPVASEAGFSMEEFAAVSGIALQTSGKNAASIAEAFGRVLPRLQQNLGAILRIPALSQGAFKIQQQDLEEAFGGGNSANNLPDISKIFFKIRASYRTASATDRAAIQEALGGTRETQALVGLLNAPEAKVRQAVAKLQPEAVGGLLDERASRRAASLSTQIAILGQSFQKLGDALFRLGLGAFLKTLISLTFPIKLLIDGLSLLANVNDSLGGMPATLLAIAAAAKVVAFAASKGFGLGALRQIGQDVRSLKGDYDQRVRGVTPAVPGLALGARVDTPRDAISAEAARQRAGAVVRGGFIVDPGGVRTRQAVGGFIGRAIIPDAALRLDNEAVQASRFARTRAVGAGIAGFAGGALGAVTQINPLIIAGVAGGFALQAIKAQEDRARASLKTGVGLADQLAAANIGKGFGGITSTKYALSHPIRSRLFVRALPGVRPIASEEDQERIRSLETEELEKFLRQAEREGSLGRGTARSELRKRALITKAQENTSIQINALKDTMDPEKFEELQQQLLEGDQEAEDKANKYIENARKAPKGSPRRKAYEKGVADLKALNTGIAAQNRVLTGEEAASLFALGEISLQEYNRILEKDVSIIQQQIDAGDNSKKTRLDLAKAKQAESQALVQQAQQILQASQAADEFFGTKSADRTVQRILDQAKNPKIAPEDRAAFGREALAIQRADFLRRNAQIKDPERRLAAALAGEEANEEARRLAAEGRGGAAFGATGTRFLGRRGLAGFRLRRPEYRTALTEEERIALDDSALQGKLQRLDAESAIEGLRAREGAVEAAKRAVTDAETRAKELSAVPLERQDTAAIRQANLAAEQARKQQVDAERARRDASLRYRALTTGDNLKIAKQAVAIAQQHVREAANEEEMVAARTELFNAQRAEVDARKAVLDSEDSLFNAQHSKDRLSILNRAVVTAQRNLTTARGLGDTAGINNAAAALAAAQQEINDYIQDGIAAAENFLIADLIGQGLTVEAAQKRLEQAERQRNLAATRNDPNALKAADQQVKELRFALRDTVLDDTISDLAFKDDMDQISIGQHIAELQLLLTRDDLTKQRRQEIQRKIKALKDESGADLQFNTPSDIQLPTLYEVRRLSRAEQRGGGYQDNRVITVHMTNNNATDYQGSIDRFADLVDRSEGVYGTQERPY